MCTIKNYILILLTFLFVLSNSISIFAHPGRLDSKGGHWNRKENTYHYHKGSDRKTEYDTPQDPLETQETTENLETNYEHIRLFVDEIPIILEKFPLIVDEKS